MPLTPLALSVPSYTRLWERDLQVEKQTLRIPLMSFYTDLVLTVSPKYLTVREDGSLSPSIVVTKEGYSFGPVPFSLVPFTYLEFESETGQNLDTLFPLRPITPASSKPRPPPPA